MKRGSVERLMLALGLIALVLVACVPSQTQGAPTPGTSKPSVTIEPSPTSTSSVERGPGSFDLADPAQGLAALDAYRAILTVNFNGMMNNQPLNWSTTYTLTVETKPPARLLAQSTTAPSLSPGELVAGEIGGIAYREQTGKPCSASVIQSADNGTTVLEPAQMLPDLLGAEAAGTGETVAGLSANHYRFDQRALGLDQGTASGEVWVAANGGVVLKYLLRVEAGEADQGGSSSGTTQWDYHLDEVNQTVNVDSPAGCPLGLVDVPRLDNATIVANQPGLLLYKTTASVKSAVDFYRNQLPSVGWQAVGNPVSAADIALLDFARGDRHLSIVITQQSGTMVRVLLERGSP